MRRDYPEWLRKTEQAIIDRLTVSPMSSAAIRDYLNDHRPQAIRKLLDGMRQAGTLSCVGRSTQAQWAVTGSQAHGDLLKAKSERMRARRAEYAKKMSHDVPDRVTQRTVTAWKAERPKVARSVFEMV